MASQGSIMSTRKKPGPKKKPSAVNTIAQVQKAKAHRAPTKEEILETKTRQNQSIEVVKSALDAPPRVDTTVCLSCGEAKSTYADYFDSPYSTLWRTSGQTVFVCKTCLNSLFRINADKYGTDVGLQVVCHVMDWPYAPELLGGEEEIKSGPGDISVLIRYFNQFKKSTAKFAHQTFITTLVSGALSTPVIMPPLEAGDDWAPKDKKNKEFVIGVVGYDPFLESNLDPADRRYCFNSMVAYCDDDNIAINPHKLSACIQIVLTQIQLKKVDNLLTAEISAIEPREEIIVRLTNSKKTLIGIINDNAIKNGISNKGAEAGAHSLTAKMKAMEFDNYFESAVNVFDIVTSDVMKQINEISNAACTKEINMGAAEWSQVIVDQRNLIQSQEEELLQLREQLRNYKNELSDIRGGGLDGNLYSDQ